MKKAIISVFLVLTLVLNMFGFGVLEVRSSAVGVAATLAYATLVVVAGAVTGVVANLSAQVLATIPENVLTNVNNQAIQNGEVIQIIESGGNYYFAPVSGLDSDTDEFASFFCDYLNNSENTTLALNSYLTSLNGGMAAANYAAFKTDAVNAFTSYIEAKRVVGNFDNYQTAMSELASALGTEWDPSYQFSFVGPLTPAQLSDVNSIHSIDFEGIHFYAPVRINYIPSDGWWSQAFIESVGGVAKSKMTDTGYYGVKRNQFGYGGASYIIYNNDIYFGYYYGHRSSKLQNEEIFISTIQENDLSSFISCNGVSLSSVINSRDDLIGSYFGIYAWNTSGDLENRPIISDVPSDTDFIDTSAGGTLDLDLTDEEAAISSAIGLGIISDNPTLEFDNEGNLISADGISLATLESLVQELVDKTYSFESFEEYLQTITQLLQAGNVNTDKIDDVLNALRSWESTQSNALNAINTNVAAIADALTQIYEVDDDVETQDTYIVEHSGLTEANTLVNTAMPFVGQMRTLINNLFDPNNFNNTPPNFHFYADFDNDGVNERYNALDLSFLETRLTNENLEDKGRFPQPVTVRELLQDILVLIVYSFFAFSMLKRIPSLINGSSSDEKNVINIRGD